MFVTLIIMTLLVGFFVGVSTVVSIALYLEKREHDRKMAIPLPPKGTGMLDAYHATFND